MPDVQPRTWSDIGRDLLRPSRTHLLVAVILLLSGLAVTMQLTAHRDQRYSTLRQDELVGMLDDVTAESRRLEAEIAQLTDTRDRLVTGANSNEVAREEARKRLTSLQVLGGTAPVHGPGIRIRISDPQGRMTPEVLLNAIEELRDSGAEVIEVDDRVRLRAESWVGESDGALTVDGVRLGRTIVLEAIGDADTLAEATRFRGGLVASIEGERVGGRATVETLRDVVISSVATPEPLRWARPA